MATVRAEHRAPVAAARGELDVQLTDGARFGPLEAVSVPGHAPDHYCFIGAGACFSGEAHSWEQLKVIREHWKGPVVLKGIQHPEDAVKATECGADGIIVSNHGGRQLDGAVSSLDMLPEIVEAVGSRCTVLFDSGIRTGTDVIKALCLGAKAVLVGRPWVYGLSIAGKEGARDVLKGLLADLDQSMGLAGIRAVEDCQKGMLRCVNYGGDRNSSN